MCWLLFIILYLSLNFVVIPTNCIRTLYIISTGDYHLHDQLLQLMGINDDYYIVYTKNVGQNYHRRRRPVLANDP